MSLTKIATGKILEYRSGQIWFNKMKSPNTKNKYARCFYKYVVGTGLSPDELLQLKPNQFEISIAIQQALQEGRTPDPIDEHEAETRLETFLATEFKGQDKKGIKDAVVSFYKANRRPLISDVAPTVRQREKGSGEYHTPSVQDVDAMAESWFQHEKHPYRDSFMMWFLASTGMRIDTASRMTFGDLVEVREVDGNVTFHQPFLLGEKQGELDKTVPFYLYVEQERLKSKEGGNEQHTFLHFKAVQHLKAYIKWLQVQDVEITTTTPLFVGLRKPHRGVNPNVFYERVTTASVNAFGNGKRFTPHNMRSFQQTALQNSGMSEPWINLVQGRKLGRVQRAYSHPTKPQLHEKYKSAIPYLVPPDEPQPHQALAEAVTKHETTIKQQQEALDQFKQELPEILATIQNMKQYSKTRLEEAKQEKEQLEQTQKALKEKAKQQSQDIELLKKLLKQNNQ